MTYHIDKEISKIDNYISQLIKSIKQKTTHTKKVRSKKVRSKKECKQKLTSQISKNMHEYKHKKRYVSPKQAIAVAYSQVKTQNPHCKRYFKLLRSRC